APGPRRPGGAGPLVRPHLLPQRDQHRLPGRRGGHRRHRRRGPAATRPGRGDDREPDPGHVGRLPAVPSDHARHPPGRRAGGAPEEAWHVPARLIPVTSMTPSDRGRRPTVAWFVRVIALPLVGVLLSLSAALAAPEMSRIEVYAAKDAQMATQALIASQKG